MWCDLKENKKKTKKTWTHGLFTALDGAQQVKISLTHFYIIYEIYEDDVMMYISASG